VTPEQFALLRRNMSKRLISTLIQLFLGLGTWRDADADRFIAQAVPLLQGSQRALAGLTATFIAEQATAGLRHPVAPPGVPDSEVIDLREGVVAEVVYRRPFVEIYTALKQGKTMTDALRLGRVRLAEIAEMDLQQTHARASRAVLRALPQQDRPRFWRRVLSGLENCAMCVVASTQRYTIGDLNPIHGGCDCYVMGIWGPDPGQVIAPELLENVHEAVRALTGKEDRGAREPDYRALLVQMTAEHGELGPLLVRPRDHFTGPDELGASTS
jgi:hypothetical protein